MSGTNQILYNHMHNNEEKPQPPIIPLHLETKHEISQSGSKKKGGNVSELNNYKSLISTNNSPMNNT